MKQDNKNDNQNRPSITPGDFLFFHHPKHGPASGEVACHGEHGATIKHGKGYVRVPWDKIHGHKLRKTQSFEVVEQGEDGAIMRGEDGKHRYVHGYQMTKALPAILLFKSPRQNQTSRTPDHQDQP
jgi:hypothetical protein